MKADIILIIFYIFSGNILMHCSSKDNINNILCRNNVFHYLLSYGMGSSDGIVIEFTNIVEQNCALIFHSKAGLQILVLESNVDRKYPTNNISILSSGKYFQDVCSTNCLYVNVLKTIESKLLLHMTYTKDLKITVTAAKSREISTPCNDIHEVQCKIKGSKVCISKELQCDSNINCGTYNLNDEDSKICKTETKSYAKILMLFAGFVCAILLSTLFMYTVKKCSPRMPKIFFMAHDKTANTLEALSNSNGKISQSLDCVQNKDAHSGPIIPANDNFSKSSTDIRLMPKRKQRMNRTKIKRMRNNSPALENLTIGPNLGNIQHKPEPTVILNLTMKYKEALPRNKSPTRRKKGMSIEREMI